MNNNELPQVSKNDKNARKGVRLVQEIVEGKYEWVFRETPKTDLGIDAEIEVVTENGHATGKLIAVQIKCGESYFSETDEFGYIFRPKRKHVNYWTGHSLPVIVIMCNPITDECWWIEVIHIKEVRANESYKITLPFAQKFNESSKHLLLQIAGRNHFKREMQRRRLMMKSATIINDREIIEAILRGGALLGFRRIVRNDYRLVVLSQDYVPFQSDSFYPVEIWKNILEAVGVEKWEIEEAVEKAID